MNFGLDHVDLAVRLSAASILVISSLRTDPISPRMDTNSALCCFRYGIDQILHEIAEQCRIRSRSILSAVCVRSGKKSSGGSFRLCTSPPVLRVAEVLGIVAPGWIRSGEKNL